MSSSADGQPAGNGQPDGPAARPRTAAQAEASRNNGAKSRGPKTVEGKVKASQNALLHGILAGKFSPLPDARLEDREYVHLRDELIRGFEPRTATEFNAIDALAFDYIKLGRSAQMQEAQARVGGYREGVDREHVGDAEYRVRLVERLVAELGNGEQPTCAEADFEDLRELMEERHALLRAAATRVAAARAADREPAPKDVAMLDGSDPAYVASADVGEAFAGRVELEQGQRRFWIGLMGLALSQAKHRLDYAVDEDLTFRNKNSSRPLILAERLATMERLQRYEAHIRRAIARGVDFLEARQRSRG